MVSAAAPAVLHRPGLGIGLMLLAWALFSMVDTSVKWLVLAGLPATQLAFMRYFGHLLISTAQMSRGGFQASRFRMRHPWLVLIRALLLVSATAFNFYVLKFLPLTITSAVMFAAPIIVCLLSWPLLGERVGPWRWFAIVLGFVGVLVVIRPFGEDFQWAAVVTVYNAFALAFYSIITRKLSGDEPIEVLQFYLGLTGVLVLWFGFGLWLWLRLRRKLRRSRLRRRAQLRHRRPRHLQLLAQVHGLARRNLRDRTDADAKARVMEFLDDRGIAYSGANVVSFGSPSFDDADTLEHVTITVNVPAAGNLLIPSQMFGDMTLSADVTMRKEYRNLNVSN